MDERDLDYVSGQAMATRSLLIVLINNLRGKGFLTDDHVMEMLDETLEYLEHAQADVSQKFGSASRQSAIGAAARRSIEQEIAREEAYPRRDEKNP